MIQNIRIFGLSGQAQQELQMLSGWLAVISPRQKLAIGVALAIGVGMVLQAAAALAALSPCT